MNRKKMYFCFVLVIMSFVCSIAIADENEPFPITQETQIYLNNVWFKSFPKEDKYEPVYIALNNFFERPSWKQTKHDLKKDYIHIFFTGYAYLDGVKCKYNMNMYLHPKEKSIEFPQLGWAGASAGGIILNTETLLTAIYMP